MSESLFESLLQRLRDGADYRLSGHALEIDGLTITLTGEQFDPVWDASVESERASEARSDGCRNCHAPWTECVC